MGILVIDFVITRFLGPKTDAQTPVSALRSTGFDINSPADLNEYIRALHLDEAWAILRARIAANRTV
jgi:hypothetical protein